MAMVVAAPDCLCDSAAQPGIVSAAASPCNQTAERRRSQAEAAEAAEATAAQKHQAEMKRDEC